MTKKHPVIGNEIFCKLNHEEVDAKAYDEIVLDKSCITWSNRQFELS